MYFLVVFCHHWIADLDNGISCGQEIIHSGQENFQNHLAWQNEEEKCTPAFLLQVVLQGA